MTNPVPRPAVSMGHVLVAEDDLLLMHLTRFAIEQAGYEVSTVTNATDALARIRSIIPDLVVSDIDMPGMSGLELLAQLRADPMTRAIPLVFLTGKTSTEDIVRGLELGADDYLTKPVDPAVLAARVRAKIERPPVPADLSARYRDNAIVSMRQLASDASRYTGRPAGESAPACLAALGFSELPAVASRLGGGAVADVLRAIMNELQRHLGTLATIAPSERGLLLLFPDTEPSEVRRRLERISREVVNQVFEAAGERVLLTPLASFTTLNDTPTFSDAVGRLDVALRHAESHLDLRAVPFTVDMLAEHQATTQRLRSERLRRWREKLRLPVQLGLMFVIGLALPLAAYYLLARYVVDVSGWMYLVVLVSLLVTSALIWTEGFLALPRRDPPAEPSMPYPAASAIIAAYLPNEAATVIETIEAFLRVDYPSPVQVILAYNTPRPLAVESRLRELAEKHPGFVPLNVAGSTSKAQNVNAALSIVSGEFVGVFDADHHPQADSFRRAWRWLASECEVVQGHCLIRNGHESWVAKTVAVEFEAIYSVSHPGRARMHGFGIFGGSNGYWRTDLLRSTRMHGSMLTEDIDSSMRVIERGARVVSDPYLISRELGPVTLSALWNQRLRWAQGWFQVSRRRFIPLMRSPHLSARQKLGVFHLLLWREIFPWLSLQMFPIVIFWIAERQAIDWRVPIFVLTSVFTLATGPAQSLFISRLAAPEIKGNRWWILRYALVSLLFYTELKNLMARLAQLKEFAGERAWKVTPRSAVTAAESTPPA